MKTEVMIGLLLAGQVFSAHATTLVCSATQSAGLVWGNGEWRSVKVEPAKRVQKFILRVNKDNTLNTVDMGKLLLETDGKDIDCRNPEQSYGFWSCNSRYGDYLFLSSKTLQGGISSTFGATVSDSSQLKDLVSIAAFKCEKIE